MSVKELIGKRIKEARQAKGLSQEALSEKIGMSAKYLSSVERGKENPTLDTLIKLADALEVEASELFNYQHERSPEELRQLISHLMDKGHDEKLRLMAKIITAIYR
ncbi:MAG: helix-turn-helix transcriptional regulator [Syntrophorhabdales bacterium]|jgi:transcriptional regulator with XRE-family HTH domain